MCMNVNSKSAKRSFNRQICYCWTERGYCTAVVIFILAVALYGTDKCENVIELLV